MQGCLKLFLSFVFLSSVLDAIELSGTSNVSLVAMAMDYREYTSNAKLLDSETSSFVEMVGIELEAEFPIELHSYGFTDIETSLLLLGGETKYVGSELGSGDAYGSLVSKSVNNIFDFDIRVRSKAFFYNELTFSYALGVAYRFWERNLSASQVETYTWYSLRPSAQVRYKLYPKTYVGFDAEYQYGFYERMDETLHGFKFSLGGVDTLQISIPLFYKMSSNLELFCNYTFELQKIKESNHIAFTDEEGNEKQAYEPRSTAKNQYIKIGASFKF